MASTQDTIKQFISQHAPTVTTKLDLFALFLHHQLLSHRFQCIGTSDHDVSNTSINIQSLPASWNNTSASGLYTFIYIHQQLPDTKIIIKILKINSNTVTVHAVKHNNNHTSSSTISTDLNINDYVSDNITDIDNVFIDETGLITLVDNSIVYKLIPQQSGNTTSSSDKSAAEYDTRSTPSSLRDPSYQVQSNRPYGAPPILDDEDEINDPLRVRQPPRRYIPGQHGDEFGGDLNPFGNTQPGNIMGPDNFPYSVRGGHTGVGMQPRFDPYHEPDNDDMRMPQFGGNRLPGRGGLPRRGGGNSLGRGGMGMGPQNPFDSFGPDSYM